MRIVVNDIAASSGGAKTVLMDFYHYLVESKDKNEWIFLLGDLHLDETRYIKVINFPEIKKNKFKKLYFDFFGGRRVIKELNADVVFSLQNIITFGVRCPQIVYVHQSIPFQRTKNFSFFKKKERKFAIYQYLIGVIIKFSIRKATKTVVQTNWMKESVLQQCKIESERVLKISPCVDHDLIKRGKLIGEVENKEFFYPTSASLYKNNDLIIDAVRLLENKGFSFVCTLTIDGEVGKSKHVSYVGRLPYEEVISKYYTSCLVFPSYIETYGYPLVEARTAGSLILASDCLFSRELLNDYENAYFFNPFRVEELAELMEKVIIGEIKKKDVVAIDEEIENSWKYVVDEIINVKSGKD